MLLELLGRRQIGGVKLEPNKKFSINHKKNIFTCLKTIANELDVGKLTDELSFWNYFLERVHKRFSFLQWGQTGLLGVCMLKCQNRNKFHAAAAVTRNG